MNLLSTLSLFAAVTTHSIFGHASSVCPDLSGTFETVGAGPLTNINLQKIENGVTLFSWSGGSFLIVDGQTHRDKNTTYNASCDEGKWLALDIVADGHAPEETMRFEKTGLG